MPTFITLSSLRVKKVSQLCIEIGSKFTLPVPNTYITSYKGDPPMGLTYRIAGKVHSSANAAYAEAKPPILHRSNCSYIYIYIYIYIRIYIHNVSYNGNFLCCSMGTRAQGLHESNLQDGSKVASARDWLHGFLVQVVELHMPFNFCKGSLQHAIGSCLQSLI